ncbi:bola protein [Mycena rebaudengoi]|nr:bola protein [Mycena rebaudengoi]
MFRLRLPVRIFQRRSFSTMDTTPPGPLETAIREKLQARLNPTSLKISNDSWQHRHHAHVAALRAQGSEASETHFTVQVVSSAFQSKTTMQRHRLVYAALREELEGGLHALSLQTKTEEEVAEAVFPE